MSTRKIKICKTPGCDKSVVINQQTGIPFSKYCPNCLYKRSYAKARLNPKNKVKKPKIRTPRQRAIDRADEWFSKYTRLIGAKRFGDVIYNECYTCGAFFNVKKMDCGHYIGRGHHYVRWDVNNARPQCTKCNCYQGGKHFEFEQRLIKEIGQTAVDDLKKRANKTSDYSVEHIREIAKTYRISVRLSEKEKGVRIWK